jgi:TonB family protein
MGTTVGLGQRVPLPMHICAGSDHPVNIDYSNLLPGDDAPDPADPKAPQGNPAAPPANAATNGAAGTHAARPQGANVVVLAADPALIELLREALAGAHRMWRADDATHAADLLVASGNAVLLMDSALADQDTKTLITKLHKQFPDLAIIVAGRRDDEHELAPLVSEGVIFRFLHKPASAERIRNFVDATQRRPHGNDLTATLPPRHKNALFGGSATVELPVLTAPFKLGLGDGFTRRWGRRSLLLIPVVLAIWGLATWQPWNRLPTRSTETTAAPTAPNADAGEEARLQKMLDAAGLALSQGALVEPPGRNALELYRAVLASDPANDVARRGLDSVADELIVQAERALMEQDLARLAGTIDAVRSVRPDHPRLPFFVSQLERERVLAGQAGKPVPAFDTMGRPLETPAGQGELPSVRVQAFVQLANERMRSNQLVGKDGALGYAISARELDASDPGVADVVGRLGAQFQANVQKAIRANNLAEAGRWVQNSIELGVGRTQIATMRADIDAARIGNERADRARLLVLANQRIAQGRLIEPKSDSAIHYVDLLSAADPNFEGLGDTRQLLAARALAETRGAIAANNPDRADVFLRAATDAGGPAAEISDLSAKIMSLRVARPVASAKPEPAVIAENAMRRTYFMAPNYPVRAREREIEGWVDLEFTVTKDGATSDAVVRGAEPAGVFDRAALDAVKRWRYEPRVVGGSVVEQRVETRLRFRLAE